MDGFKKWVPVKFARGRFSPLLRLKVGECLIVPHKEFKPLYNTVYQFKKRHPGIDFEYLECVNGYVVKRTV
jgi:hypothetical protein